jgi:putative serine protease PepD
LAARDFSSHVSVVPAVTQAPLPLSNTSIAQVAAKLLPSTVQVIADLPGPKAATGSGFVFDTAGHVITNNHVVADAAASGKIRVIDYQGNSHKATIVGRSQVYDVAVLEVAGISSLPPVTLGASRSMQVGDSVVAIGSPLGLSSTVTSGIISALDRPVSAGPAKTASFFSAVQTDAAINPGNSGGPLVNLQGEVIGVNSAIATVSRTATEAGSIGVGFAIPIEQVKRTADQIVKNGHALYPVIGASVDVGARGNGAYVEDVPSGTPSDQAGIKKGDVVVAFDGIAVHNGVELIVLIRLYQPGDSVTLSVRRDGTVRKIQLTLGGKEG